MKVYFIGAGPGDPGLLTIKAAGIIERADIIIYAGSLVNKSILKIASKKAILYDSSRMALDEILDIMRKAKPTKKVIARIHSGDPSIYGAIQEQLTFCEKEHIRCEVIPGVSSFCAAAAALKQELTLPDISQTVIITRLAGRTAVSQKECLRALARIRATLVIFLSVDKIHDVVERLLPPSQGQDSYDINTPAAVVSRVSWRDEKIIKGTLGSIAAKVKRAGIEKQALIIVGDVLRKKGFKTSMLYDKNFSHSYRKAR